MSDFVEGVLNALKDREILALATVVAPPDAARALLGRKLLVREGGPVESGFGLADLDERVEADCRRAMAERGETRLLNYQLASTEIGQLGLAPLAEVRVFIEVIQPSPTLLIVGAGHVAQPIYHIGNILGFAVVVMDDRPSFANRERFPEAEQVIVGPIDEELARFPITAATYIVLVTRGHAQDELALRQVVTSKAAYVGMIGSRRRTKAVLQRLAEAGVPREAIVRVCTPIGLDINAETPEEIAVSILAEVINVRRGGQRHASSLSTGREQRINV